MWTLEEDLRLLSMVSDGVTPNFVSTYFKKPVAKCFSQSSTPQRASQKIHRGVKVCDVREEGMQFLCHVSKLSSQASYRKEMSKHLIYQEEDKSYNDH